MELVIGDRVALVVGTKAYRGVVDHDPNRAPGAEWFVKLETVEQGEPNEVSIHVIKPEVGTCDTAMHSADNHPRQADCTNFKGV